MLDLQLFFQTYQPRNGRFFTIAIDGRSGSGKSTVAALLKKQLPDFVVLNGDDYFEPIDDLIVWGEFNDERFIADVIEPLRRGNNFTYRSYDWHAEPHITERNIEIAKGLCLERCYSFQLDLDWDLKIWVETPKEICLERGLAREIMPPEKIIPAWKIWQQQEDEYIRNFKPEQRADIIVDGLQPFS